MFITVKMAPDVAQAMTSGLKHRDVEPIIQAAHDEQTELIPVAPASESSELASYFSARVADADAARRLVRRLQQLRGVDAAFVKPIDEPP
jgi:glutamine synthetase adenylyltransferase